MLHRQLRVMDATAITLARDNHPAIVLVLMNRGASGAFLRAKAPIQSWAVNAIRPTTRAARRKIERMTWQTISRLIWTTCSAAWMARWHR